MLETREATPADAEAIAAILGIDHRAAERLCRDRAVRIALEPERDDADGSGNEDADADGDEADPGARAVLAYEVRPGAVHVARLGGSERGIEALLPEPERFAAAEDLPVEAVVPADDDGTRAALATAGFEEVGEGPIFEGEQTVRYRLATD